MLSLLAPLVLLVNGVAAGVLLGTLLGGWPLLAALPDDRYVHAHAFFATRYDPAMPVCLLGTLSGDVGLAVVTGSAPARFLFLAAALLAVSTIAISLSKNVPTNKWIQTVDPSHPPTDLRDRKRRWGLWNRRRSLLTLLALVANCTALAVLL
ncbi:anthrone oxygenase family protein [Streptacidiphilus sp. PAMC 29251]